MTDWSGVPSNIACQRCANGVYHPGTGGGVGYPPELPWVLCKWRGSFQVETTYLDHHKIPYPWIDCQYFMEDEAMDND